MNIVDTEIILKGDVRSSAYKQDSDNDEMLDFYEAYFKEKVAYMNLFINKPPTPKEMQEISAQAEETIDSMRKEMSVQLEETRKSIA